VVVVARMITSFSAPCSQVVNVSVWARLTVKRRSFQCLCQVADV
jgi:hypothetical protein